ncbi:MAG TPA: DUF1641 domain-containing protein [Chthoniobacterales bacterium]|jgi:hypothetical protein|nr:DUF1641 domain-containing protein [Chthoniobacterales bacterium]
MSSALTTFPRATGSAADALLEKLEDPRIVEALVSLLDKSDKLTLFSELLESFLQRNEGLLEIVSRRVAQLGRAGTSALGKSLEKIDLDDLKSASGQIQGMLPLLKDVANQFTVLKQAGFFDPDVVEIIGRMGRAVAATARDPKARSTDTRGVFSLLGLLKDPDIARTLNFVISFARHFGGDFNQSGPGSAVSTSLAGPVNASTRK